MKILFISIIVLFCGMFLIFQLHLPGLALSYCDRVYEAGLNQQPGKTQGNIYLPLMQVYLNPRKKAKNVEKRITSLVSSPSSGNLKAGWSAVKSKGKGLSRKIAEKCRRY